MKTLIIPWYTNDIRFEPGTVADIGKSLRLTLRYPAKGNEYRLYLEIRTSAQDGVKDDLKREVKVATFKNCTSLKEAQHKAREWFTRWTFSILNSTNFNEVLNQ